MGAPGGQSPDRVIPGVRNRAVSHPRELATLALGLPDEVHGQLRLHPALTRERVFTQDEFLANARRIKGVV